MDSTLGILKKGYTYFGEKFDARNTDVYPTRLFLKKTIAIRGRDAAKLFSDREKFIRKGATPKRFQKTLFGEGGVQGLDHEAHIDRKALFMNSMDVEKLKQLDLIYENHWKKAIQKWKESPQINLFEESQKVLTSASCEWSGVPLGEKQVALRARQLSEMIEGSGGLTTRYLKGKSSRKKAEKWISALVKDVRNNKLQVPQDSVMYRFSMHRDLKGDLLNPRIAAVEILNIIRPTVAIGRYVVFLAHALHLYPIYHEKLKNNQDLIHHFVQEVRRHYPFFPFTSALVKESFKWNGVKFP
jgi:fatty-acid peroxygenase